MISEKETTEKLLFESLGLYHIYILKRSIFKPKQDYTWKDIAGFIYQHWPEELGKTTQNKLWKTLTSLMRKYTYMDLYFIPDQLSVLLEMGLMRGAMGVTVLSDSLDTIKAEYSDRYVSLTKLHKITHRAVKKGKLPKRTIQFYPVFIAPFDIHSGKMHIDGFIKAKTPHEAYKIMTALDNPDLSREIWFHIPLSKFETSYYKREVLDLKTSNEHFIKEKLKELLIKARELPTLELLEDERILREETRNFIIKSLNDRKFIHKIVGYRVKNSILKKL